MEFSDPQEGDFGTSGHPFSEDFPLKTAKMLSFYRTACFRYLYRFICEIRKCLDQFLSITIRDEIGMAYFFGADV